MEKKFPRAARFVPASALILMMIMTGPVSFNANAGAPLSEREALEIGREACIYFYPLVTMDVTRRQSTNIEAGKLPGLGPMNTFSNMPTFPSADFRVVVRPNLDTLYSSAWLDLTDGPVIVSVPDTNGRYYLDKLGVLACSLMMGASVDQS
jgi:hypothetical protein